MTEISRRPVDELATPTHDPRTDWPSEARQLRDELVEFYGEADSLPDAAGAWVARFESSNTRRAYARRFRAWEAYVRAAGVHPLRATVSLAEAYARHLEQAPATRNGRGGSGSGAPLAASSRAQALSGPASFYSYAAQTGAATTNPFSPVRRPKVDPDYSPTTGLTVEETTRIIVAARARSLRSYALVTLLYTLGARINQVLALDVEDLGYDRGHHVVPLVGKGGGVRRKPVSPLAWDAVQAYMNGRTSGPLFITRSARRWSEPEVWKHLRVLARDAELPQADSISPHTFRHGFITDALDAGVPLHEVQYDVDHADPRTTQRYNRRKGVLDRHPGYLLARNIAQALHDSEEAATADPPPA